MGIGSAGYNFVFLLHILFAIVGFGAVLLNGVYGAEARKRRGTEGLAIVEANFRVAGIAEKFIFAVPIWGFGLIGLSDGVWTFGQPWVWLSLVLYALALTLSLTVVVPTVRSQISLMKELTGGPPPAGAGGPPPQVAKLESNGKKLASIGAFNSVVLVAIIALMIWKPGI